MTDRDYWGRVEQLKLYSVLCRRECYFICITWTDFYGYCAVDVGIVFKSHLSLGSRAIPPQQKFTSHHNYLTSMGPALFNITPKPIKTEKKHPTESKKSSDKFFQEIPDKSLSPGHLPVTNNSPP